MKYLAAPMLFLVVVLGVFIARPGIRDHAEAWLTHRVGEPPETEALEPFSRNDPPQVRLAVAGDVGTGGEAELATARAMDDLEEAQSFDALLLLGDNAYPDGDPDRLPQVVFDPFAGVLDGETQLLAVLGNHDVRNDNADRHVAAIGMPARWYATRIGDALIVSLDSTSPTDPDQLAWLEQALTDSDATWKIATMHHPPYSAGYHGSSTDVRNSFAPIFEHHGVQLVLAGHDHDYQRSQPIAGITYIVSGGAAKLRPTNHDSFTAVAWSTHHFLDLAIWPDRIKGRAVNQQGRTIDTFAITAE